MFKKMFYVMAIIIFCAVAFSGYLHEQDINDLAYVIAVGFDVGNDDKLKLTFQISIPSGNSSGSSGGGDGSSSSEKGVSDTLNQTVECNSFNSGLNTANNIISKRLNLSHCKFIIFSEELASQGISDYIYTLENNIELRSNCNILVSTSTAEEFINSSTPILEHSTSKYYEIITTASRYSGYTSNATLNTVYTSIADDFSETSTMLGNVQKDEGSEDESSSGGDSSSEESGSSGGNSSSSGQTSSENGMTTDIIIGGIAVFKKDKLVGTLSKEETVPYLIVTDKLKECVVSIPSPFSEGNYIDLHIYDFSKTKNIVKLDSSGPQITTDVTLKSTILSNDFDFDSSSKEDIEKIISAASNHLKNQIMSYYEKTAREFKSDITGLGKHAVYKFPTISDWENYNWPEKFETATFDVNVQVNIESSYFIS